jgi:hypothetical protein
VHLVWAPVAEAEGYAVELESDAVEPRPATSEVPVIRREVEAAELTLEVSEATYRWRVRTLGRGGLASAWSATRTFGVNAAPPFAGGDRGTLATGSGNRLDVGAQVAFVTNFGAIDAARFGIGAELRRPFDWGHAADVGVRLEYFTVAAGFSDLESRTRVRARMHAVPVAVQVRYRLPAWSVEWMAGLSLGATVAMAWLRIAERSAQVASALLWRGGLLLGGSRSFGPGSAFVELSLAMGTRSSGAVEMSGERLAVVAGYRLPVW